ncbi:hypothetical protein K2X05_03170 [bacterium]|nr:hypothetical protein [bacterium]
MRKYISTKDTAKLVRTSLKEAFPDLKISVRMDSDSLRVEWIDGANEAQVKGVISRFSGAYFDGMTDYEGSKYHMMNGQSVSFGAKYISCRRQFSDVAIERAINQIYRQYQANFAALGLDKPRLEQFKSGELMRVHLMENCGDDLQRFIRESMVKNTDRIGKIHSVTAAKVFQIGTDGHGASSFDAIKASL